MSGTDRATGMGQYGGARAEWVSADGRWLCREYDAAVLMMKGVEFIMAAIRYQIHVKDKAEALQGQNWMAIRKVTFLPSVLR